MPGVQSKPIPAFLFKIRPHNEVPFDYGEDTTKDIFMAGFVLPVDFFKIRAAIFVIFFMNYRVQLPSEVLGHFEVLLHLIVVSRYHKNVREVRDYQSEMFHLSHLSDYRSYPELEVLYAILKRT